MAKKPALSATAKTPKHFIHEWRKHRRVTQEELAAAIGLTSGAISQLERGVINYTQPTLESVADALNCKPSDLLGRDPRAPQDQGLIKTEPEILAMLARIEGLTDSDITVAFAVIKNALDVKRAAQEPSDSRDQPQPASRPRVATP